MIKMINASAWMLDAASKINFPENINYSFSMSNANWVSTMLNDLEH